MKALAADDPRVIGAYRLRAQLGSARPAPSSTPGLRSAVSAGVGAGGQGRVDSGADAARMSYVSNGRRSVRSV